MARRMPTMVLWLTGDEPLYDQALEECLWALQFWPVAVWRDTPSQQPGHLRELRGPIGIRRERLATVIDPTAAHCIPCPSARAKRPHSSAPPAPFFGLPLSRPRGLRRIVQNLHDAELLSWRIWKRSPRKAALRLIPRSVKETVNAWVGREIFDLSFYERFENRLAGGAQANRAPLTYAAPPSDGRRRIALCTPNLGPGGAERVLLSFARSLDRDRFDLTMLATDSGDSRLLPEWRDAVDRIYDLGQFAQRRNRKWVIQSLAHNWRWDCLVLQNDLAAYDAAVLLSASASWLKKIDILHNLHDDWDLRASTAEAAANFDRRVVISGAGREELLRHGSPAEAIRLIRTGIDLQHFDPARFDREQCRIELGAAPDERIILFIGHLIERKRPLMLTEIDQELQRIADFPRYRFLVVGDGPELAKLERYVRVSGARARFELLGQRDDIPALLVAADALVVPSEAEGTPLVISEALAMQTPVVSTAVGAVSEILPADCGFLLDRDAPAQAYALHLAALFSTESGSRTMGEAGRDFVLRQHDLLHIQREYAALLEELLAERGREPQAERLGRSARG